MAPLQPSLEPLKQSSRIKMRKSSQKKETGSNHEMKKVYQQCQNLIYAQKTNVKLKQPFSSISEKKGRKHILHFDMLNLSSRNKISKNINSPDSSAEIIGNTISPQAYTQRNNLFERDAKPKKN